MAAFEWFESLAAEGKRIEKIKQSLEELDSRIAPKAQGFEPTVHGGGGGDGLLGLALVSIKLADLKAELPRVQARHDKRIEYATQVLYGRSGRGGLAKARTSTDADIICCHYLQGMGWAEIAQEVCRKDTEYPSQWCRQRAVRACLYIDKVGMDVLARS